jgi:PhzF family phenazine biosynthesis protein
VTLFPFDAPEILMSLPFFLVDAFTSHPFAGNPAGVCLLDAPRDDAWLQHVAAEINQAETAFLLPEGENWRLRWLTPEVEVDLCGHATLASAFVLWRTQRSKESLIRFNTRSGILTAKQEEGWIELDFPALPCRECDAPAGLLDALGEQPLHIANYGMDYLCEFADEEQIRRLTPDFQALRQLRTRGVVVTARGKEKYDMVSRFFAPAVGVSEDPVTGSAHCALGPWWAAKLGKNELLGYQASKRGGEVRVSVRQSRVALRGQAVLVVRGELMA